MASEDDPEARVPRDSLILDYQFDQSSGATVTDSSGNGRTGTIVGDPAWDGAGFRFTGSNYVKLPDDLVKGEEQVSVSVNFSPDSSVLNKHIFLWNLGGDGPSNQGQLFVSFFDGGRAAIKIPSISPWELSNSFERDFRADQWQNATVTLDGATDTMRLYLDGMPAGSWTNVNESPADLVTHTKNLLGASAYDGDPKFKGQVSHFRVYGDILTAEEVSAVAASDDAQVRNDPSASEQLIRADIARVFVPTTTLNDLVLPDTGQSTTIVWKSSDPALIGADGSVVRPELGQPDGHATLTARFSYGPDNGPYLPQALEVEYPVTVPAIVDGEQLLGLAIPGQILDDLPSEVGGSQVVWSSTPAGYIAADGSVTTPPAGSRGMQVHVRATVDDSTIEADAIVLPRGGEILSYVVKGGNVFAGEDLLSSPDSRRSDALYVAQRDGDEWQPLNKGKAILYVRWDGDQKSAEARDWQMGSPTFYRARNGDLGVVASSNNAREYVYVWGAGTSPATFGDEVRLKVASRGIAVQDPSLVFDAASQKYKLYWNDGLKHSYVSVFAALTQGATPESTAPAWHDVSAPTGALPAAAVADQARSFAFTDTEIDVFVKKYADLRNTGVRAVEVTSDAWANMSLPDAATFEYNDGSTKNLGVTWSAQQLAAARAAGPGTYQIEGQVDQDSFGFPFIEERADPHIFFNEDDDHYYATGSYYEPGCGPVCDGYTSYGAVGLRRSPTLAGLREAPEHLLMSSQPGDRWGGNFWAPEFHKIGGTWYMLVGAHDFGPSGRPAGSPYEWVSASILVPFTGTTQDIKDGKMLDPAYWGGAGQSKIRVLEGAPAFDVNYFEDDHGQGYWVMPVYGGIDVVKASTDGTGFPIIDPADHAARVKGIDWPWEYGVSSGTITAQNPEGDDQWVVEGPFMFEYGDYVYMTYSGGTVDKYYNLGVLRASKGSDLQDPESWTKEPFPGLMSYDTADGAIGGAGHVGGGHNSMMVDESGNLVLIYHARPNPDPNASAPGNGGLWDPSRHTMVKSVNVRADGSLALNITADEEVAPEFKTITATVTIAPSPISVSLGAPVVSRASQPFGAVGARRLSVSSTVSGITSGTVTFTAIRGGRTVSLGTASVVAGKAMLRVRSLMPTGSYSRLRATLQSGGADHSSSLSTARFVVARAVPTRVTVSGRAFKRHTKPVLKVTIGRLDSGVMASGRIRVLVGGKAVKTAALPASAKGVLKVRLPNRYSTAISARVIFVPDSKNVASKSSPITRIKVRR